MLLKKKNYRYALNLLVGFAVFLTVYLTVVFGMLYFLPMESKWVQSKMIQKTISLIPYPIVCGKKIWIKNSSFTKNVSGMKNFYEKQDFSELGMRVDFSTGEGQKRFHLKEKEILEKLIEDAIIKTEAQKRNLSVTAEIIHQEVDRKLKEYGAEKQLKENLQKLYGWDMDDFEKYIVASDLYKERLALQIKKESDSFSEAKKRAALILTELESGVTFSEMAIKYSEGESAEKGGSLGWFSYDQMLPEISAEIRNMEIGQNSKIIESSIGYHIIFLENKKNENEQEKVSVSQIFIRAESFPEWLSKQKKNYPVFIINNSFYWNKQQGKVEFRDQEMRNFEKESLSIPRSDDPSVLF